MLKSSLRGDIASRQRRGLAGGGELTPLGGGYIGKALGYGPIAYWPQYEAVGPTINCLVNPLQNGTYMPLVGGPTLGQAGIGDGNTCPYYDAANDYGNVFTATLQGNYNGAEGSALIWMYPMTAWGSRCMFSFNGTGSTYVRIRSVTGPNRLIWYRYAPAVLSQVITAVVGTLNAWYCLGISWSESANEMKAYLNGVQSGATQACNGAYGANTLSAAVIGALDTTPTVLFLGRLAHLLLWDAPIGDAAFLDLATV